MTNLFSDPERALLDAILAELIPANPDRRIPNASEAETADYLANQALANAGFQEQIRAFLSRAQSLAGEVNTDFVRQLETELPEEFSAVLTETYKGYYSRPDIRAKVGVGAHPIHPDGYPVARETPEFMDQLTAPVRARGPIYRDPTGPGGLNNGK